MLASNIPSQSILQTATVIPLKCKSLQTQLPFLILGTQSQVLTLACESLWDPASRFLSLTPATLDLSFFQHVQYARAVAPLHLLFPRSRKPFPQVSACLISPLHPGSIQMSPHQRRRLWPAIWERGSFSHTFSHFFIMGNLPFWFRTWSVVFNAAPSAYNNAWYTGGPQ